MSTGVRGNGFHFYKQTNKSDKKNYTGEHRKKRVKLVDQFRSAVHGHVK